MKQRLGDDSSFRQELQLGPYRLEGLLNARWVEVWRREVPSSGKGGPDLKSPGVVLGNGSHV